MPSKEGLLLAAGGEGKLTDGQGLLWLEFDVETKSETKVALKGNKNTLEKDWGRRDPLGAAAAGEAGHVLELLGDPRAEPAYDLNQKGMDHQSFEHLISKRAPTEEWKGRWTRRKGRGA